MGRKDEMIKTSGYRVSPSEIEEAAYNTGLVRDAVALGVEDEALGQRIVLVATPTAAELDVDTLTAALRQILPLYMVPSRIDVRDELHRSPNGKVRSHAPHAGGFHVTPQEHTAAFGTTDW